MIRRRGHRYAALALFALACGDTPTAPDADQETVLISLVGISIGDAGIVLEVAGAVDEVQPGNVSLDVAWERGVTGLATVVIVGPLADHPNLLVVKRRAGHEPLRVEVREIAGADGSLSSRSSVRAIVQLANSA